MRQAALAACMGLAVFAGLGTAVPSRAHEVQPMIATVTPSGTGANYRLMIRNTNAMPITLEITPYRVMVDDEGSVTRTPEEADVILFPPQTVVAPSKEQAIQVRYVGDPTVTEGRIYAIVVGQLPVDFSTVTNADASTTQVKIGFDFVSHMIVQPAGAKPVLTMGAVRRSDQNDLVLDITNTGNGVAMLRTADWVVTGSDGSRIEVPSDDIAFGTFGAILPGGKRTVTIPAAELAGLGGEPTVTVELK